MTELPETDLPVTAAATFCATLVDEWVRCGVTDAVVAPGSRSTPLALALAADGRLRIHVHHDERSAAFMALGIGLATGRPAPILTTSGTATVELHPAVVEAHHARVPMICCTADRPPELHHIGAPQTVDQTRLYGPVTRWYVDPGVPDEAARSSWRSLAARAVAEACGPPAGPVQLNLPFRDPLVGRTDDLPPAAADDGAWHHRVAAVGGIDHHLVSSLIDRLGVGGEGPAPRGVIVAGAASGGRGLDPGAVHHLAQVLGWPVLAEPRSGCRTDVLTAIAHADALLRHAGFAVGHVPDVVLQLGQPLASKVVGQWLAASGARHVVVDPDGWWFDPDRTASVVVAGDPSAVAAALCRSIGHAGHPTDPSDPDATWLDGWSIADAAASSAIDVVLAAHTEATEPAVARDLLAALPDGGSLVVASSMPVRDVEWYGAARADARVLSNRGANGIDGVVSTAVGVALAGEPTALLIGDVALLHDTNGLLGLSQREVDLVIVVVDNDGGGIFSFLPQATQLDGERFEQLFGTPHGVDLAALAAVHGIAATVVEDRVDVVGALTEAFTAGGLHMVVVRTDRTANVAVHDEIHAAVAACLAG
ncbi:MAG: 2-succinyl-5-enolpyruvyl-6-hydroxy-3-cyclohexene-1-carboxylic-acid synthase [Acidimicrobiia bacterium]|nr:2-succinyl-5-enolpyruvyl-6-hydroxy-3-cyclohexene-1-carboxylic-acid synthase [Acidimicrobiia bacterium]